MLHDISGQSTQSLMTDLGLNSFSAVPWWRAEERRRKGSASIAGSRYSVLWTWYA